MKRIALCLAAFVAIQLHAAEVIPPKPSAYFNDYAGVVSKGAAQRFNEQLAQFERDTSNQVVVAVFPKMQSESSIEDYTQRVAQGWGIGQKERRNGAVLFVFIQDRKIFIQVGYGLEGALPDATCFDITEYQIKPHFRNNDIEGGLAAGVESICLAIRGEYTGSGRTVREQHSDGNSSLITALFVIFMIIVFLVRVRRAVHYTGLGGPFIGGWSGGSGGGWSSGGGGGGFSGFSGGGGSFGGGGAGSSW